MDQALLCNNANEPMEEYGTLRSVAVVACWEEHPLGVMGTGSRKTYVYIYVYIYIKYIIVYST
jgi:hypothetical protein